MKKQTKDTRSLAARLWTFQKERAPLYGVAIMSIITAGVVYRFSDQSWYSYAAAILIISLYLIQIRTADEKKDFEHDNKYHPDRPVQRGVVTLNELAIINTMSIVGQLLLYASFANPQIFLLGVLSQSYAFLTRKEFFVRDWIRQHFYIYYVSHYVQLVILFYAITSIIRPIGESYWSFISLFMLCVITTEIGRKMFAEEDDTIDDTYSAQLGHKGSAVALTTISSMVVLMVFYFIQNYGQNYIVLISPILVLAATAWYAYAYSYTPNRKNAKMVEKVSGLLYVVALFAVITGV
jgi:hypothetical protein